MILDYLQQKQISQLRIMKRKEMKTSSTVQDKSKERLDILKESLIHLIQYKLPKEIIRKHRIKELLRLLTTKKVKIRVFYLVEVNRNRNKHKQQLSRWNFIQNLINQIAITCECNHMMKLSQLLNNIKSIQIWQMVIQKFQF